MAKSTEALEVERKFDVVESTVSPSFDGLSAVSRVERSPSHQLDAVYFDTPRPRSGGPTRDIAQAHRRARRRVASQTACGTGCPHRSCASRWATGPKATYRRRCATSCWQSSVIVRSHRLRGSRPAEPSTCCAAADGTALAEFCDDQVTAQADPDGPEQQWREWELELAAGGDRDLLERLSNRLLDAGAEAAGHGSKLARVLDTASVVETPEPPDDPIHRAVAEQVEELLEWDRAVRADVYDSVHQMRVTTRKIRSLLQSSEDAFGISDDAWILDELRQLAAILGVARDAEVLAERYESALEELPVDLVRGPIWERLVDGAKRRYASGLRRSLIAMRSQRYFRLLDALDGLVATEPPPAPPGEEGRGPVTIESAYKKIRKAAKAAAQAEEAGRDEALHRIRKGAKRLRYTAAATGADDVSSRAKTIQSLLGDHQDSVVSRTHLRLQSEEAHACGEDTFTYGLLYQLEDDLARRSREQLEAALKKLDKSVRKEL